MAATRIDIRSKTADHFLSPFLIASDDSTTRGSSRCLTREEMSERAGCSCKLAANRLEELLQAASGSSSATRYPEDCALLPFGDVILLKTIDFGPVTGVDLVKAGVIAANNSLSDIYACGGEPKWADVIMIVDEKMDLNAPTDLQSGLAEACRREGVQIVGGHTIVGPEAVVGLSVVGLVGTGKFLSKRGALPGDTLLLSKPLGTGLIVRAYKSNLLPQDDLDQAVKVMVTSNRGAARAAVAAGVRAMSDCTGFGLAGTVCEMLMGQPFGAVRRLGDIPILPAVIKIPQAAARTRYVAANAEYVRRHRQLTGVQEFSRLAPLFAPETSGGLVCAAAPDRAADLAETGLFQPIGEITHASDVEVIE